MASAKQPSAMAPLGPRADAAIAEWLSRKRHEAGLSQADVARRVTDNGVSLSRGHYANLERGTFELRPDHVAALDRILRGNGELIILAERKWKTAVALARQPEWAQEGKRIQESFAEDGFPSSIDEARLERWWREQPTNQPLVVDGSAQIERAVLALITIARRESLLTQRIDVAGTFDGFRGEGRAGFPLAVRHALRSAMENGWECHHHIPLQPGHRGDAALVHIATPLMACPRFQAYIVDATRTQFVENLLVIPDFAAVQFFATASATEIDVAVIHRNDETRRVLTERIRQLEKFSFPFVERFERSSTAGSDLTTDEVAFRERLAEIAKIDGMCRICTGWFPSQTIPRGDYENRAKARQEGSARPESWDLVMDLHAERVRLLEEQLSKDSTYRVIIAHDLLAKFETMQPDDLWKHGDGDYSTREERIRHLKRILELMDTPKERFQIAIASDELARRLRWCSWSVREGRQGGAAIVQTTYTPVGGSGLTQPQPVDLKITATGAVRAFMAYFAEVWSQSDHDQRHVRDALEHALTTLGRRGS